MRNRRSLSTRARVVLVAALAALPLLAVVTYAAVDRYSADHAYASTRATNRAQLYATLLAQASSSRPTPARLQGLLEITARVPGSALVVFDGQGRQVARAGAARAGPLPNDPSARAVLARRAGTFEATGPDGVKRVWGLASDGGSQLVAFGLPGEAVDGAALSALKRDIAVAIVAAGLAMLAAFLLAGRVTAPIRRLAVRVAGDGGSANEIGAIERGFSALDDAVAEGEGQLALRVARLAAVHEIDRAILDAQTPDDIAQAAIGRLRELLGAQRAEVLLFDREQRTASSLAVDTIEGTGSAFEAVELDDELLGVEELRQGLVTSRTDLEAFVARSPLAARLFEAGVRCMTSVPLLAEGELLGALKLGFDDPAGMTEDALVAAGEVADQLAIALSHARLYAELQAVVDAALDAIVVFDDEMRVVSANEAAGRLIGRPADQLVGLTSDQIVRSSDADFDLDRMRADGPMELVVNVEFVDGGRRVLETRGRPDFLPGRHLFILRDVTERERLEQQLRQAQKLEAVGQLAGGIAHDFNNLLTAITGYGAIARETIAGGPGAGDLDEIEQAAQRAVRLTQQLLAFSRQQMLEPVVLDLHEVLDALMPMLARLIGEDVTIDVTRGAGMPCVLADRGRIEQVIVNLAVNARDAMPTGGTLTIETQNRQLGEHYATEHLDLTPGRYACLSVSDTGIGIEREQLEHIFEPFFTTKDVDRGTGLGLATVHGIVTQSGGDIHVSSEPGIGTSFKVYLPATDASAPDPRVEEPASARPASVGSETILLCEDEDMVRRLTERMLTGGGYVVLARASPQEALDLAEQLDGPPALLVTDVVMPGMSGPELAEQLARLHPGLPTLFLSGYSADVVRSRANLPRGAVFLEKPFDRASLLHAVRGLLDHAQEVTSAT